MPITESGPCARRFCWWGRDETGDSRLVALVEHALSTHDPRLKTLLEFLVLFALGDVRTDRGADDFGHGLIVNRCDRLKLVGLVSGQPDRHGLNWFHRSIMPCRLPGV
jgi:hypothetical protein